MRKLLELQDLDLRIEECKRREQEIPKQKNKLHIHRERLKAELTEREETCKRLTLEQRNCEGEIAQKQAQITKYQQQLNTVKKNEEYQALLHEIDMQRKQIAQKEERILAIMEELEEAHARLEEDRKRIEAELAELDRQGRQIDQALDEAVGHRKELESREPPLAQQVDNELLRRYRQLRNSKRKGAAVVPLTGEVCGGCHMALPPQIVNEILAGHKIHSCKHCGRLLYHEDNYPNEMDMAGTAGA